MHSRNSNVLNDTGSSGHCRDIGQDGIKVESTSRENLSAQSNDRSLVNSVRIEGQTSHCKVLRLN